MEHSQFSPNDLFVSPEGDDYHSGIYPESRVMDGPLRTLDQARTVLRMRRMQPLSRIQKLYGCNMSAPLAGPVNVWLREGTYHMTGPVVFAPQDSIPVVYRAYPGEHPVIDGSRRISGWKIKKVRGTKMWVADIPGAAEGTWRFRQLFVNKVCTCRMFR